MSLTRAAITIILSCFFGTASQAGPDAAAVLARNKESCQLIQSVHCQYVKTEYDSSDKVLESHPKCEYWRRGNKYRMLWKDGTKWCDTVVLDDGTVRSKSNAASGGSKSIKEAGVVAKATGLPMPQGDPWFDGLIAFNGEATQGYPTLFIADIMKSASDLECEQGFGGLSHLVVVKLRHKTSGASVEYRFDTTKNFLISFRQVTLNNCGQVTTMTAAVESFVQPVKGIYFPEKIVRTDAQDGRTISRQVSQSSNVKVNTLLDDSVFDLAFSPNTDVADTVRGISYNTGRDGHQEERLNRLAVGESGGAVNTPPAATPSTEPQPNAPFIFAAYGFGILLCVLLIVLIVRHRKR